MRSLAGILAMQNTNLQSLLERAAVLDGMNRRLLQYLPAPLNAHVALANVRDNTAIIMASSSVWLTRARYLGPDILNFIRQEPVIESTKSFLKFSPLTNSRQFHRFGHNYLKIQQNFSSARLK